MLPFIFKYVIMKAHLKKGGKMEDYKKHSVLSYLKLIFSLDKRLIGVLFINVISSLTWNLLPIGILAYMTKIYQKNPTKEGFQMVFWIILANTIYHLIYAVIIHLIDYEMDSRVSRRIEYKLSTLLYSKLDEVDYEVYQSNDFLNHYEKALDDGASYMFGTYWSFTEIIEELVQILSVGTIFALISPWIILYVFVVGILTAVIFRITTKISWLVSEKNAQHFRERGYIKRLFFLKDASIDLKSTTLSDLYLDMNSEIGDKIIGNIRHDFSKRAILNVLGGIATESIIAVALSLIAFTTMKNNNIVILASLVAAASTLADIVTGLTSSIARFKENVIRRFDVYRVLDQPCVLEKEGTINTLPDFKEITFDHVHFSYQANEEKTLNDISFRIEQGQKIAIVGENGAGKTTLVRLFLKLIEPTEGAIFYNQIPYKDIQVKTIRKTYATVFQNYQIYSFSVAENILLKKLETKDEEIKVIEALKKVGLWEKISHLEKGINTICTKEFDKDGVEFSGGERQKLVIARVFVSSAPILILDEPNSALDPLAEKHIFDEIFSYAIDKTLIFISHRFSTTIHADKIYLFEQGSILEQGTHHELMLKNGEYKRMFMTQAEKYQEEAE